MGHAQRADGIATSGDEAILEALRALSHALSGRTEPSTIIGGHEPSGTEIDLSLGWLDFERVAMDRSEQVDFGGVEIRVARPEDLIIYKAVAWRDRDRDDIKRLLALFPDVDKKRIIRIVREFCQALEQPEVAHELSVLLFGTDAADD